jgi:hypothetical protein
MSLRSSSVTLLKDLAELVLGKLHDFNPSANYFRDNVIQTLREVISDKKVDGIVLRPDRLSIEPISPDSVILLTNHCCLDYVNAYRKTIRLSKSQNEFAINLEIEIHRLENGEALFSGYSLLPK